MFDRDHGIIISCDISSKQKLKQLVASTCFIDGIVGYKLGFVLGLELGLLNAMDVIRDECELPVIYDHQKAANDIPGMGIKFAEVMKAARMDSAILFPFTGIEAEKSWIAALQKNGIMPMVGGEMTHPGFFDYIKQDAPEKIYSVAASMGVGFFVVPGTKPERIKEISQMFPEKKFCFPGIGTQGGDLAKAFESAPGSSYAIIGSAIYDAKNPSESARAFASIAKRF
ncbi:MAG: orotidine 5'-phosphate decarboxylase [Candidatus Aenigmarchaeota archaeon]|nr:orotidine 5'-phosphate decarboxylase [Candidatus Aenigmarchaeota archaeon]